MEDGKRKRGDTVDSARKTKRDEPTPEIGGKIDGSMEGYKLDDLSCTICLELLDEPVASESQTLRRVLARHATGIPTVAVKVKSSCIRYRFSTGMHVDGLHAKRSMSPSHESIPCGLKVRTHYGTAWFMMYQPWSILRSALLWPLVLPHLHEGMGQGQGRPHMPHAVHPGVTR